MKNQIQLLFCGDLAPIGKNEMFLVNGLELFADVEEEIKSSDLSFVNLESPLTISNQKILKNGPRLKAAPSCIDVIQKVGFSLIGLANNHVMDYGERGLSETIICCNNVGLDFVGAGSDLEEAQQIYYKDIKGVMVAIIAIAEYEFSIATTDQAGAAPVNTIDNYKQILEAKDNADIVVVTIHGGNEYFSLPRPGLRKTCKHYVDLGVDAIICHHPHVPGAFEHYKGAPIFYSIGNFLFDVEANNPRWDEGYMVKISIDVEQKKMLDPIIIPYTQDVSNPGIIKMKGKEKELFINHIESLNAILLDNDSWLVKWDEFCLSKKDNYIINTFFPFKFRGLGFLSRKLGIGKLLLNRESIPTKINQIECDSHREAILNILRKRLSNG